MQKLRELIANHDHWAEFDVFIERIELSREQDFSLAFENAKSLLESVCKEICKSCGAALAPQSSMNGIVKNSFSALGFTKSNTTSQISRSLANIGQIIGDLRNDIGITGHGRTIDELRQRNSQFDELTKDFLFDSIKTIVIFLIRAFEQQQLQQPPAPPEPVIELTYEDCDIFNEFWDEIFGELAMGEYSYPASMVLFQVDSQAYHYERLNYEKETAGSSHDETI